MPIQFPTSPTVGQQHYAGGQVWRWSGPNGFINGGNGGSGIAILRYVGSQRGTGGTVVSSGGYTYHVYTTSGTFTR